MAKKAIVVKFVDENEKLLTGDAKQAFGIDVLQTVVVSGKTDVTQDGHVSILANKIYIQK